VISHRLTLDTILLNTVYENKIATDSYNFGIGIYKQEEGSIEYRLSIEEGKRYQPYNRKKMSDKKVSWRSRVLKIIKRYSSMI